MKGFGIPGILGCCSQNRLATWLLLAMLTSLVVGRSGRFGTATTPFASVMTKLVLVVIPMSCIATWKRLGVLSSPVLLAKEHRAPVT